MKEFKIDRKRMIELMKEKVEEGYKIVEKLNIRNKDCVTAIVNIFELEKTINDLILKEAFDKEVSEKDKKAIKKALSKNKEVEVKGGNK